MELALPIILRDVHIPLAIYSIMYYHSYHQDLSMTIHITKILDHLIMGIFLKL